MNRIEMLHAKLLKVLTFALENRATFNLFELKEVSTRRYLSRTEAIELFPYVFGDSYDCMDAETVSCAIDIILLKHALEWKLFESKQSLKEMTESESKWLTTYTAVIAQVMIETFTEVLDTIPETEITDNVVNTVKELETITSELEQNTFIQSFRKRMDGLPPDGVIVSPQERFPFPEGRAANA